MSMLSLKKKKKQTKDVTTDFSVDLCAEQEILSNVSIPPHPQISTWRTESQNYNLS